MAATAAGCVDDELLLTAISNSNWRDDIIVYIVLGTNLSLTVTETTATAATTVCDCRSHDDVHFNFPYDVSLPYVLRRKMEKKSSENKKKTTNANIPA